MTRASSVASDTDVPRRSPIRSVSPLTAASTWRSRLLSSTRSDSHGGPPSDTVTRNAEATSNRENEDHGRWSKCPPAAVPATAGHLRCRPEPLRGMTRDA